MRPHLNNPNGIIVGTYYRVTRRTPHGPMHTFLPLSAMEMPVEAGDVITKYTAPRGLDAGLCIDSFSELVGPAYPEVTRVTVFDGILFNQQDGHMEGADRMRPVRTMKHALKLQAEYTERREYNMKRHAAYMADIAQELFTGKSYRTNAVSLTEAIAKGFGPGWYIRQSGHDVWSPVTSGAYAGSDIIFGYRESRYRRNDGNGYGYKLLTESFHPSLHELIIRPTRPTFGPVVDAEGFQPAGWDSKIPFINAG